MIQAEGGRKNIASSSHVLGNQYIVEHCLTFPQTNILEGSGNAQSGNLVWGGLQGFGVFSLLGATVEPLHFSLGEILDDFLALEENCSVGGGVHTCYHVESSGFSRSVGANEGNNFTLVHFQRKGVYRHNTTKLHGDIFHGQDIVFWDGSFHGYLSSLAV